MGRPSYKPVVWYKSFLYQAASWKTARRVAAKVEFHFGELFPVVGFIVTNLETDSRAVVRFYNKRGTSEQWIKVGKQAVKNDPAELPSVPFQRGAAMAERNGIQHGQPVAVAGTPRRIDKWSLTCLQQRLLKTGGRLLKHARY